MTDDKGFCQAKVDWLKKNECMHMPETHVYDHTSGLKGDYCFWCGRHRSGDGRVRADAGTYTEDDWFNDAITHGFEVE